MNLHAIVGPVIAAVNPPLAGTWAASDGSTTGASGKRTPVYATAVPIVVQVQPLTYKDLMQIDGLNVNGEKKAMYITGDFQGVLRPVMKGGDLVTLTADSSTWLVVQSLEGWSLSAGWCKVAVVRQTP